MAEVNPYAIIEIEVEELFGYINQTLSCDAENLDKISQLAILYGENGTGKTSILRLAFHLLSPRVDRGHKTRLVETTFKFFRIKLRNGAVFTAEREQTGNGAFLFSVKRPKKKLLTHYFKTDHDELSIEPYQFEKELQQVLHSYSSTIIFLRDDRLIEIEPNTSTSSPWEDVSSSLQKVVRFGKSRKIRLDDDNIVRLSETPDQLGTALQTSISRLDRWFTVEYGQQTNIGMVSSHAIYQQVIDRVVSAKDLNAPSTSVKEQISRLKNLSKESEVLDAYGLSSLMNVDHIVKSLVKANESQLEVLEALLTPYIDTVEARFSALREIYKTIDTFVTQTNIFMYPKQITYRVGEGLKILSPRDQVLKPTELSSGERHLLLILSSAVLARNNRTLFIVDEPEISLNTTWQRKLAGALLSVSENSVNQYLLASHSLSLISDFREHVMRLQHE